MTADAIVQTDSLIATEPASRCPCCDVPGEIKIQNCHDHVTGLPGRWAFAECAQCGSLWLNPRPREDELARLYPENYKLTRGVVNADVDLARGFTASAKMAALASAYYYESVRRAGDSQLGHVFGRVAAPFLSRKAGYAVRYLPHQPGARLLDVGCGNGAFIQRMKTLGWEVEGVEVDPITADLARKRGLTIYGGDVESLDLPSSRYDAITLTHVTEHFFHPREIFGILHRWLKPGGALVSLSPNPRGALRRIFRRDWYELDPPRHIFLPSATAYGRLLEPLGFAVKTWTSMRPFHWMFKESANIALHGKTGMMRDGISLKLLTKSAAALLSIFPGMGEEVICHARKRH